MGELETIRSWAARRPTSSMAARDMISSTETKEQTLFIRVMTIRRCRRRRTPSLNAPSIPREREREIKAVFFFPDSNDEMVLSICVCIYLIKSVF